MNIGQSGELKYQWGIFTHFPVRRLCSNVEQRCPGWLHDAGMVCESL